MKNKMMFSCLFVLIFGCVFSSHAKRDFYVLSELSCDYEKCYLKDSGELFNGEVRSYDKDGKLLASCDYKKGIKHGKQMFFYSTGKIRSIEHYIKGKLNGKARSFYIKGSKDEEIEFSNGLKNGVHRRFFKDGKIMEERFFKDGIEEGVSKKYYENGDVMTEVVYEKGKKISAYCITDKGVRSVCDAK
jgi:antitoxin component YwqK of YwqJK toxin-antitoxin module